MTTTIDDDDDDGIVYVDVGGEDNRSVVSTLFVGEKELITCFCNFLGHLRPRLRFLFQNFAGTPVDYTFAIHHVYATM